MRIGEKFRTRRAVSMRVLRHLPRALRRRLVKAGRKRAHRTSPALGLEPRPAGACWL